MIIPLGFDESYQSYLRIYEAHKVPLNEADMKYGHSVWVPMSIEDRRAAYRDLLKRCQEAKEVRYIPTPQRHLFARSWERQVLQKPEPPPAEAIRCQKCLDAGFIGSDVDAACDCEAGLKWREDWCIT